MANQIIDQWKIFHGPGVKSSKFAQNRPEEVKTLRQRSFGADLDSPCFAQNTEKIF